MSAHDLGRVVCAPSLPIDVALERLKRQCEGILREVKAREAFELPGARRRRKARRARKRLQQPRADVSVT